MKRSLVENFKNGTSIPGVLFGKPAKCKDYNTLQENRFRGFEKFLKYTHLEA